MEFETHSYRNGKELLETQYPEIWEELKEVLTNITDEDLKNKFPISKNKMSLSAAINNLIKERLVERGWLKEAPIFQGEEYEGKAWRLDFAKEPISIEVSFNHGEALAWNLTKPTLASEVNNVKKAIETKIGVIILASKEMKTDGAFDNAVGEYEKCKRYLRPMRSLLTVPMVLIGLKAPKTFYLEKVKDGYSNKGIIRERKQEKGKY